MIFQRLVWAALAIAIVIGTSQSVVQRWQVTPLILAVEMYEHQKAIAISPLDTTAIHVHAESDSGQKHEHSANKEWKPANSIERLGWTWVANILHAFSMSLMMFVAMCLYTYKRAGILAPSRLAGLVAAAGWLSFHLWPSLGLHAELPGADAGPLLDRQMWWALAVFSSIASCVVAGFVVGSWRWMVATALLVLPFLVGAPQQQSDRLAGFGPEAHAALEQLEQQFIWATTWVSLSFWVSMGVIAGFVFQRWLHIALMATLEGHGPTSSIVKKSYP